MKRSGSLRLIVGAIGALLFVVACGLLPATPTPVPPFQTWTPQPVATFTPTTIAAATTTAVATATATPTPVSSPTPTALAAASATPTATPLPPTATSTATRTQVPPTPTFTPTRIPPTPTFTRVAPTATHTSVPPVRITDWRGDYYANRSLQGSPQVVRNDTVVDLSLPAGAVPAPNLPSERWSARWSRTWRFEEGNYRFHLLVDDGARLWVAGRLLIDAWSDGPAREFTNDLYLRGDVPIQLDYYNNLGDARVRLNWERVSQVGGWLGSYYAVPGLSGLPLFQRDDPIISFNWGSGSPRSDVPADNFSVRWTRRLSFSPAGAYRFRAETDDGTRLWVDGRLVIDAWRDGYAMNETIVNLSAGAHDLRLDYYEHLGGALAQLSWEYLAPSATPTSTPSRTPVVPTDTPTPTPTSTATTRPSDTPTATPTDTALPPPTDTPTATPTDTALPPPTVTPTPTDTALPPPPIKPDIGLQPNANALDVPFEVRGRGWPANAGVDLFLVRPVAAPAAPELALQAASDGEGSFAAELVISTGQGWEGLASALILAQTADGVYSAQATLKLLPPLSQVRFAQIPSAEERFALPQPTYLVLDSEAAWTQRFGPEPPPADPPVDWQRELVLGAFLGPQPAELRMDVGSVVQREATVSVWLTSVVPPGPASAESGGPVPRALVRVERHALMPPGQQAPAEPVFAFLDASGRLLAQGPAGNVQPVPGPEAMALGAPAPKVGTPVPEAVAPQVEAVPTPAPGLEATAPAAATAAPPTEPTRPVRTAVAWLWLIVWIVLLAGLAVGAGILVWRYLKSR